MNKNKAIKEIEENIKRIQNNISFMQTNISTLEDKLENLKKEQPTKERVFGDVIIGGSEEGYYTPLIYADDAIVRGWTACCEENYTYDYPVYKNSEDASKMSQALNTMLRLRTMEGVVNDCYSVGKWYILIQEEDITVTKYNFLKGYVSPAFDTKESAQKAIDVIGRDVLEQMFKVLGGFSD